MALLHRRLSGSWLFVTESVIAASIAWLIATSILGVRPESFFAPASTMLVLGQIRGQRVRRALEVWGGVLVGILTAHLLRLLTDEPLVTVAGSVLVLSLLAVLTSANAVVVVQGSVSALYVAVGPAVAPSGVSARLVDVVIGGGCALVISQAFTGRAPARHLREDLRSTLVAVSQVLDAVRAAASGGQVPAALDALEQARRLDARIDALRSGMQAVRETSWLRRRNGDRPDFEKTVRHLDYAVRNLRVLARSGVVVARSGAPLPAPLEQALRELSGAVTDLGVLLGTGTGTTVVPTVLHAARTAGEALGEEPRLASAMMIGQIRGLAVDLLRMSGVDERQAPDDVDEALARPVLEPAP
ncbi:FUSC family protein [Kineosporia succinea]|uniref:Uncharacterized membrane protein YgaE (UPF0421/DUF939 family) n=1 Tax=Kineosporia succinea TaxID=84632 RepID=A0ABT9PDT9_9ACTN|nr:FUSC family protein [Kineosporia succinea]MDP9830860.1 uncharacterized membrane protein YgaE (UPF0421/DUF939 family) [Kineosporia succinea]